MYSLHGWSDSLYEYDTLCARISHLCSARQIKHKGLRVAQGESTLKQIYLLLAMLQSSGKNECCIVACIPMKYYERPIPAFGHFLLQNIGCKRAQEISWRRVLADKEICIVEAGILEVAT